MKTFRAASRERLGAAVLVASLLGASIVFLAEVHRHYPIHRWLFWVYAAIAVGTATWWAACTALGHVVLRRVLGLRMPLREHLLASGAVGVLAFAATVCALGLAGGLGRAAFFGVPAAFLAVGGAALVRDLRPVVRRVRRLRARGLRVPRTSPWIVAFGTLGLALAYAPILSPANVAYDSRWYHLGIAEHYAVTGTIGAFPEGFFQGTLPQLASLLYTWALLAPGSSFVRIELAVHLELALFLATLAALPLAVRWLTGGRSGRGAWVAIFLFPELLLYDSNLNVGADHVLAFWGVPIVLALRRASREPTWRTASLLGLVLAGAALTKYQAVYLLAGAVVIFVALEARRIVAARPDGRRHVLRRATTTAAVALAVTFVATTPHWLKNLAFYGNPLYPFLHDALGGHPWAPGTKIGIEDPGFRPVGPLVEQIGESLRAALCFSFEPRDWPTFHGDTPVFGSLFTLLLVPALLTPRRFELGALAIATMLGVSIWFFTYHQDRYLQALVPWMAAFVAATLVLLFRERGPGVRAAAGVLVALQIVWSLDVPFFPTHAMTGELSFAPSLRLAAAGHAQNYDARFETGYAHEQVARALPEDAVVLLHEEHMRLGLGRAVISDSYGRQGAIAYAELRDSRAVQQRIESLGATHVVWTAPRGLQRFRDDLVFFRYARALGRADSVGPYRVVGVRGAPRLAAEPPGFAAVVRCATLERTTFDAIDRVAGEAPGRCEAQEIPASVLEEASSAEFVLVGDERPSRVRSLPGFRKLFRRGGYSVFEPVRP